MPAKTKTKEAPVATTDVRTRLLQIESELGAAVMEREDVVRSVTQALLTKNHILLLGPPGTAKSYLTDLVTSAVSGASSFSLLLSKTTDPSELFGQWDISQLSNGVYNRLDNGGTIRGADVAFLDEVFKAPSSTLNALLGVLNERKFRNGTQGEETIPLNTAVGCSNEYPQGDELAALFDRFLLRHWIGYMGEESNWTALLLDGPRPAVTTTITLDELRAAQAEVAAVTLPRELAMVLLSIRSALGNVGIVRSDRRWRQAMDVVRAQAWLSGRDKATKADLLSLSSVLWDEWETEGRKVTETLLEVCAPKLKELLAIMDLAHDAVRRLRAFQHDDDATRGQINEAKMAFSDLQAQAEALIPDAGPDADRHAARLVELAVEAAKLHAGASW
jgi:MoxR-like ATPase